MKAHFPVALVLALSLLAGLGGCKLVKKTGETAEAGQAAALSPEGDMDAQVAAMWESEVLPHFETAATDLATLLPAIRSDIDAAGEEYGYRPKSGFGGWNFATRFEGEIVAAETDTRAATADVDIDGDGAADAKIQLGPVIRGTAIRDTLPFIDFTSFGDQIAFAQLSRSMNTRAYEGALEAFPKEDLVGKRVAVTGAMSLNSGEAELLVTPVRLQEAGAQ